MTPPPAAAAARTAPAVHPRRVPLAPPRRPRRVSGPGARPAQQARRATSPAIAVATHPLLDRLIHGRTWIGIVAFALIGIVTMQLGLLKLNAGIGRALEHETALQREDSALSVENSEVAAGDTVELQAAHMGMQLIPAGGLRFLSARGSGGEIARAIAALNARASGSTAASTSASASSEAETPATSTSESTASTEAATSAATPSTAPAEPTESATAPGTSTTSAGAPATGESATGESATSTGSASAPTPTPASPPDGESGGASANPQG